MRHVKLEVITCEHTGELGFRPKIFSNWESYIAGTQLGHDLIDHSTKESGEVWQEFKAFGANLFVSEFGNHDERIYFAEGENQEQKKGYIFGRDLSSVLNDSEFIPELEFAPKVSLNSDEKSSFEQFWKGFCNYQSSQNITEDDEHEREYFANYSEQILSWMKYGFKCAKNRFGDYNSYEAFCTKKRIDKALTNYWKEYSPEEGHEATISFDVSTCSVEVSSRWAY